MDTNRWWKWRQHMMYTIGFAAELQVENQFVITRITTVTQNSVRDAVPYEDHEIDRETQPLRRLQVQDAETCKVMGSSINGISEIAEVDL